MNTSTPNSNSPVTPSKVSNGAPQNANNKAPSRDAANLLILLTINIFFEKTYLNKVPIPKITKLIPTEK